MHDRFEIRDARRDERAAVGRVMVEAYAGLDGFPPPAEQPDYYAMLADVGRFADRPGTRLLVAVAGAELLGGVVYFADLAQYGAGGSATREAAASGFRLLGVAPRARGRGVGAALVAACIALARGAGHRQLLIHTTQPMSVARGMYERRGFVRSPDLDFMQGTLPVMGFRLEVGEADRREVGEADRREAPPPPDRVR